MKATALFGKIANWLSRDACGVISYVLTCAMAWEMGVNATLQTKPILITLAVLWPLATSISAAGRAGPLIRFVPGLLVEVVVLMTLWEQRGCPPQFTVCSY